VQDYPDVLHHVDAGQLAGVGQEQYLPVRRINGLVAPDQHPPLRVLAAPSQLDSRAEDATKLPGQLLGPLPAWR